MRRIFADTYYWIALLSPRDDGHQQAVAMGSSMGETTLLTTDEVLVELLTFFSRHGASARHAAAALVENIMADDRIVVFPQTRDSFLKGLELYQRRPDKTFSLVDCIVMSTMRRERIAEILSRDEHFTQEGFQTLL